MNELNRLSTNRTIRTVAFTALLVATSVFPLPATAAKNSPENHVEARISELRAQIQVTPSQEDQWGKVTEVMRSNARALAALTEPRLDHAKSLSAVDDLKSYGQIAAAHAEGIQKLIPVFETLYASLSDAQKKKADEAFRYGHRHHRGNNGTL